MNTEPRSREELEALGYETDGDCFVAAFNFALDTPDEMILVHGEVSHGDFPALRYTHAWVEQQIELRPGVKMTLVHDPSNGRHVQIPKELYYLLGRIVDEPGKLARYSQNQARRKALATGHYGPWDLDNDF
ncbi:hypothetical protein [Geothermobacter hydrogeniphilus]|uniref:Uncharacterized protein n=1 Tax=Geothermobacter hydrogeniphilus TaxID=1969733 RepID=A0A1X0Y873_9BACT|nr:hypothetical protein [Geothermobacter hydrogeniphilus]ORJ61316.1 hypothetical protein B5V00_06705 [Geothermobacter hydrogeniphilus]